MQSVKPAPASRRWTSRHRNSTDRRSPIPRRQLLRVSRPTASGSTSLSDDASAQPTPALKTFPIDNKKPEPETFLTDVSELRAVARRQEGDGAQRQRTSTSSMPAPRRRQRSARTPVPLKDWAFRFDPRDEWRQMFVEAWRLERDYFYDRGMHGLDWPAIKRQIPAARRSGHRSQRAGGRRWRRWWASCRPCTSSSRGDVRRGAGPRRHPASLGAQFARDEATGGVTGGAHLPRPIRTGPMAVARWRGPT